MDIHEYNKTFYYGFSSLFFLNNKDGAIKPGLSMLTDSSGRKSFIKSARN